MKRLKMRNYFVYSMSGTNDPCYEVLIILTRARRVHKP